MIVKQIPEDFRVFEVYDFESIKNRRDTDSKEYYYFVLTKKNYTQMRALERIASAFNTSRKLVYFAGTKDKVGVTKQLVCVYGIKADNFEKNLEYFNSEEDLNLEFLGKYNSRLVLGDNLGNRFEIVVRDLNGDENNNLDEINKTGVLNFFDSQRFGYAGNSHIVGKYLLKNDLKNAVFEIMSSRPSNSDSELLNNFVDFVDKNFEEFAQQNVEVIDSALAICPRYLSNESQMLEHLKKHKNDFPGAFRKIHKKLRMLYISAYQSYIFNETILKLKEMGILENYKELELVLSDTIYDEVIEKIVFDLLEKDGLVRDNFKLKSMPEFKFRQNFRDTRVFPKNIVISEFFDDELNEGKKKLVISFELGSGEYATNVITQLFE